MNEKVDLRTDVAGHLMDTLENCKYIIIILYNYIFLLLCSVYHHLFDVYYPIMKDENVHIMFYLKLFVEAMLL